MFFKCFLVLLLFGVLQWTEVLAKQRKHVVCYHGTWATYRQSLGKFDVVDIDPFLCTHLMYAFFGIEETGELRIIDPWLDLEDNSGLGNIRKFNALKLQNPTLKTLAAVGGWNEGSKKFSDMANDPEKRARFVKSVVRFIQKHGFDGLDLDWEYPNQRHSLTSHVDDKNNYVTLLRELREGLDPFGYMLTAAVGSAEFSATLSYDIPEVIKYLDIINVMAYDLHGPWDDVTGINAPLYAGKQDTSAIAKQLNVDAIMKYWIKNGAPLEKLVLGVPFYGRSFTLETADQHTPGAPHIGRGIAGQYSVEPGVIGYNEMCEKLQSESSWTVVWEPTQMCSYAYREQQWVGYETTRSIGLKTQYAVDNNLAGIMIWSIESDDFRGTCSAEKYPLLREINRVLFGGNTANVGTIESIETITKETVQPVDTPITGPKSEIITTLSPDDIASTTTAATTTTTIATTTTTSSLSVSNVPFTCHNEGGYVRDTSDCSKFYYCDHGTTFNFQCPNTLRFDLTSSSCNYANVVKC